MNKSLMWAVVIGMAVSVLTSCKLDMPKETETSFETMVVDTTDIETPMKFSAKMKGRAVGMNISKSIKHLEGGTPYPP